ncbi:unnamed protein product [Rhodiola kirilowii]
MLRAPDFGVLAKRADLRWNRKSEDMEQLKKLQDELLHTASMWLNQVESSVYSTCSIDPGENEERVTAFLTNHPEFSTDPADKYAPDEFITEDGFYASSPVKHALNGAFAARLVRL